VEAALVAREVTAVDASASMLARCEERVGGLGLTNVVQLLSPIEQLRPEKMGHYDLVLCSSVLEYVADLSICLDVLGRLLTRDGRLLVSFPNAAAPIRTAERWSHMLIGRPRYRAHVQNVVSRDTIVQLLASSGLVERTVVPFGWPRSLDPLMRARPSARWRVASLNLHTCQKL
jgi:SAM-dependent methyltransferase